MELLPYFPFPWQVCLLVKLAFSNMILKVNAKVKIFDKGLRTKIKKCYKSIGYSQ